jgi:GTP pyrophosphokinase
VIKLDGASSASTASTCKLKRQKIDLERVYDFVALRVITQSVKDCYAALGIIHQTWSPVPGRIKDFIAMPRPNGYQSLHTSVISDTVSRSKCRSARGDAPPRRGRHRGALEIQGRARRRPSRRALLPVDAPAARSAAGGPRSAGVPAEPEDRPLSEEVYIFTPKGEVRSLPRGATAVDFAYSIHTDVGNQCVGARINGTMVPLRTRLQNGDIVEIVTQAGTSRAATGSRSSSPRARAARSSTCCRAKSARAASSSGAACSTRKRAASI